MNHRALQRNLMCVFRTYFVLLSFYCNYSCLIEYGFVEERVSHLPNKMKNNKNTTLSEQVQNTTLSEQVQNTTLSEQVQNLILKS